MEPLKYCLSEIRAGEESHIVPVRIPTEAISVLTQVRKSMDVTDDLMPSMYGQGQQSPGIAAALTEKESRKYIKQVNDIWRSMHHLKDQKLVLFDGVQYYVFLVAGHRRHAACKILSEMINEGDLKQSTNFDGMYSVRLHFGLTATEAIQIQFHENRHSPVPPQEEARAAWDYYRWLLQNDPSLSQTDFAKIIGRTPEWIRSALRFCRLPKWVQDYVDGRNGAVKLPYGILVHLARLGEKMSEINQEDFSEEAYKIWLHKAIIDDLNVTSFGQIVSEYIQTKMQEARGQYSFFGPITLTNELKPTRQVFEEGLNRTLLVQLAWLRAVKREIEYGGFGNQDTVLSSLSDIDIENMYSPGSPIKSMAKLTTLMGELLPDIISLAKREGGRHRPQLVSGISTTEEAQEHIQSVLDLE